MLESVSSTSITFGLGASSQGGSNTVIENIKCFVRCRPLNEKEKELCAGCLKIDEDKNSIIVENKTESKNFENKPFLMDYVFKDGVTQDKIFEQVAKPILKGFFQGYNCTIFAYGQTGAGKTHTMLGPLEAIFDISSLKHGLIPRILHYIFAEDLTEIKNILTQENEKEIFNLKMDIKCSCLEIYQEQIIDLLSSNTASEDINKLVIREDAKKGMFIDGLTEMSVKNDKAAKEIIMLGLKNRHVAATSMNSESSRSHLIFTIFLNLSYSQADEVIVTRSSRLHMIDLAGSERQKSTKAVGERIKEAGMINKSLSTLGNVINALVEMSEGKTKYVPFRDSKLTFFLKDSLGGNAKTTIIANISQSVIQTQETISTLKFVQRAKMIKNKAVVNENVSDTVKILQNEIKKLKEELSLSNNSKFKNSKVIVDYICPICKNDPVVSSTQENIQLSTINSNINLLLTKIDNLFRLENTLLDKFKLIDTEASSSIEKFFLSKEIHENDYSRLIDSLEQKLLQFNKMISSKENIINEVQDELRKFKKDDLINNLFIEKINFFIDELIQFKSYFEVNDLLSLTKLREENKQLKNELEALNYLKDYYTKSTERSNKSKMSEFYQKQSMDKMSAVFNEFVESNRDLKTFFNENFGNNNNNPLDANQYSLIEKTELERIKFQLEDLKLNEDNNIRLIDDLQSETFLLNMELAKYKEGNIIVNNDAQSIKSDSIEENSRQFDITNQTSDFVNESPKRKNQNINDDIFSTPNNDNNNFSNNLKNYSEKNIYSKHNFIKNLRSSLIKNSPNRRMMHSSLLYSAHQPLCNFPMNENDSTRNSLANLTRENIELIKLKEKFDDVLINLEDKNIELNQRDEKIGELLNWIDNLKMDKDKLESSIKQFKDEIDTLYDSNSVLTSDIIMLNFNINSLNSVIWENDAVENLNRILKETEELNTMYLNDLDRVRNFCNEINNRNVNLKYNLKMLTEDNHKLKINIENNESKRNEELKTNNEEIQKILKIIKEFQNEKMNYFETFSSLFNDKLDKDEIVIDKIKENLNDSLSIIINNFKFQLENAKNENETFRRRIKNIFGNDFDFIKFLYGDSDSPIKLFNWDKLKLNKLERRVLELKEEKKNLKMDLALLTIDFNKGLTDSSLNNKIQLLMRIKEENYKLKIKLNELKRKNETLESNMTKLQESLDNVLNNSTNFGNLDIHKMFQISCSNLSDNFSDENKKLRKEYNELLDKIFELDVKHNLKDSQSKFAKALEILKNSQEIIELNKFHTNVKYNHDNSGNCEDLSLIEKLHTESIKNQSNTLNFESPLKIHAEETVDNSFPTMMSPSEKQIHDFIEAHLKEDKKEKEILKKIPLIVKDTSGTYRKRNNNVNLTKNNTVTLSSLTPVKKKPAYGLVKPQSNTNVRSTSTTNFDKVLYGSKTKKK